MKKQKHTTPRPNQASGKKTARRDTKRRGEIGEVEAFCGRERNQHTQRSRDEVQSGSPQPKSRAQRGTSTTKERNNQKRRGEIGEAAFLAKAAAMGFGVAKPWGDSDRYDFIVDVSGRLLKVQIKSAHCISNHPTGGYNIRCCGHQRGSYQPDEIDLLVAYIVPEEIWYIFPPSAFRVMKSLRLFPHKKQKVSKFNQYREAWHYFHE